jgi:hypothetical protein
MRLDDRGWSVAYGCVFHRTVADMDTGSSLGLYDWRRTSQEIVDAHERAVVRWRAFQKGMRRLQTRLTAFKMTVAALPRDSRRRWGEPAG